MPTHAALDPLAADRHGRTSFAVTVVAIGTVGLATLGLVEWPDPADHGTRAAGRTQRRAMPSGALVRQVTLGRSVRGRPITATVLGDPRSTRRALIVGCIHGDERAGIAIGRRLARGAPVRGAVLWIVPDLNPDGAAADTRQNAHGVDLNRNFPYRWRPLGPRGTQQYAGTGPLSEPESRIARRLILRVRPAVSIWFHQPLGVVDESGGDVRVERRFARLAGLPLRRLERYPGSATTWQDHRFARATAFVVELPAGRPTARDVARWTRAVRTLAAAPTMSRHASPRPRPGRR